MGLSQRMLDAARRHYVRLPHQSGNALHLHCLNGAAMLASNPNPNPNPDPDPNPNPNPNPNQARLCSPPTASLARVRANPTPSPSSEARTPTLTEPDPDLALRSAPGAAPLLAHALSLGTSTAEETAQAD